MSKYEIVKSLRGEIRKINRVIDRKIIMGMPYGTESRRHKFLLSQLNHLFPQRGSWLTRSMNYISLILL